MPSGAKKRKAVKKKKAKEANNTSSVTHGDDDLKQHDEKESDGGEVCSPASQDHHNHQHPFTDGEEEEVEKREIKVEGVVQIDREAKSAHESESKDIRIEYAEAAHEKHTSSSSSSSSSDDESHVKKAVMVETAPFVDAVSIVVTHSIPVGNTCNSVVDNAPVVATERVSLLEEVAHINESASVTSDVVEPGFEENGEKKLHPLEENVGVSIVAIDLESQEKENEVVSTSDGIAVASLDARGLAAQETDDKMLVLYNAPGADTNNGAEHLKDPKVPECSDIQPLGDSAPRPVQTTSWKSCCGLFELLTGSSS